MSPVGRTVGDQKGADGGPVGHLCAIILLQTVDLFLSDRVMSNAQYSIVFIDQIQISLYEYWDFSSSTFMRPQKPASRITLLN